MVNNQTSRRIYRNVLEKVMRLTSYGQVGYYRRLALLTILALGLLFRLIHFQTLANTAFFKIPLIYTQSDMYAFWEWAQEILEGDLLGRNTYHFYYNWMGELASQETWYRWWGGKEIFQQAPLYPYWLAGILALSNLSIEFVIFLQLVLGSLHPLLMYFLARRVFNKNVGLVAAAFTAIYGPFIFNQGALLRDWIPPILEPLALLALLKAQSSRQAYHWSLAGAMLGLAVLTKETILLFFPFAFIWILVANRKTPNQAFSAVGLVALGLLLTLSPLFVRNALVGAPLFSISNRTAEGLIVGNAADGFPLGLVLPPSMKAILERSGGRTFAVIRETLKTYEGNPYRFVELQLLKLRGIADPFEIPNNLNFLYGLEISPILRFTLRYGMIAPMAAVGFLCSLKTWREHVLIGFFGLATLGSLMSTIILERYRLILVPVLIVYAAVGVTTIIEMLRRKQIPKAMAMVALLLCLAGLQNWLLPIPLLWNNPSFSIHGGLYSLSARIYAAEGKFDQALGELRRLRIQGMRYPNFPEKLRNISLYEGDYRTAWAMQLLDEGRPEAAREQLVLAESTYADHFHLSKPHYNLGLLYLRFSELSKTQAHFERFLEVEPEGTTAHSVRQLLSGLEHPYASHPLAGTAE
jgi:4-amino-4-deoxy-L-arabinose transferase-like glycosyltransferase